MHMFGFRGGSMAKEREAPPNSGIGNPSPSHIPNSAGVGPARPLRLVYCDEKGKFVMDPEAVATLQLVKGPIGVVSVCGRARQGKSYILNQSVEETECRRSFDYATEVYMSSFDCTKPADEAVLREAHEVAIQKALEAFNSGAVGAGTSRQV